MDGALKKKGISLSMQYLNETPLGQIKENKMKNFIKKYDGDLGTIGLILVLLFTEQWEDNFEMTLTVVAIVFLSILLILSIKKKLIK